jgi:hypothetical protein
MSAADVIGAGISPILDNPLRHPRGQRHMYAIAVGDRETGEEFKLSGAVPENRLAHVEDGKQVLLTYKGKPKGTYLDFSVMVWGDEADTKSKM